MAKKATGRSRPKAEATKTRVLIIDDHPIVRRGLAETIRQESDMDVCGEAEDARSAIAMIRDQKPDVAVVDLTLKDIGGLELIKQIRAIDEDVIMLVLSMHDETLYAERCLRAGAKGYIMKQEGSERLITALRTVLAGQVYLSEKMSARMLGKMVGGGSAAGSSPLEALSDRELEVFELLGKGLGTRQIAERLCVSIKTVESHREHIKQKLNIKNATELVQHATQWVMSEGAG